MGRRNLHTSDAQPEEQGSFCDTDSRNHYDNVDGFTKESQCRNAEANGSNVTELDEPINGDRQDAHSVDQRFNLYYAEEDDHGFFHSPAKHGQGG